MSSYSDSKTTQHRRRIWEELNNRSYGVALFLNMSKAFDCVIHKVLLNKLEAIGIRGMALSLIASYLSDRRQATVKDSYNKVTKTVERIQSDSEEIILGVPQGTVY